MKQYLIETFKFNDFTNRNLLSKISRLPDKREPLKFFSHLINSQFKWMARLLQDPNASQMSWWDPVYKEEDIEAEWTKSLELWIKYVEARSNEELNTEIVFIGFDGGKWAATPKDIALQLNYHSIHHRAQIQTMIRQQGIEPSFVDYIGTKYRRLGD